MPGLSFTHRPAHRSLRTATGLLMALSAPLAGAACDDNETLLWRCDAVTDPSFELCAGREAGRFSRPTLRVRILGNDAKARVFPADPEAPLYITSNLYAANYDVELHSGQQQMTLFEDVRSDEDGVSLDDAADPTNSWNYRCQSSADNLLGAREYGRDRARMQEAAERLRTISARIGSLEAAADSPAFSNRIQVDAQGELHIESTQGAAAAAATQVDPYRIVTVSLSFGGAVPPLDAAGLCPLAGLNLAVRDAPGADGKSPESTHPVSFYACASHATEMRDVYHALQDYLSAVSAAPSYAGELDAGSAWPAPAASVQPRLAVIEHPCLVESRPFDQVCYDRANAITDLRTGKDHQYRSVVLLDPAGTLRGQDWQVHIEYRALAPEAGEENQREDIVSNDDSPSRLAARITDGQANAERWTLLLGRAADEVADEIRTDRQRMETFIAHFPRMGVAASYALETDGTRRHLGTITVDYPGS